jgi:hypothetical protein
MKNHRSDILFHPQWEHLCGVWFIRIPFYMRGIGFSNSVRLIEPR